MANFPKSIITPSDKQIRDLFALLMEQMQADANFSIGGFSSSLKINDESFIKLVKADASLITNANIQGIGFNISFQARHVISTGQGAVQHPYYSTIAVNTNDSYGQQTPPDANSVANCQVVIGRFIKKNGLDAGILGSENESILEPHVALLSKLESAATEQIARTNDFVHELTLKYDERNQELNDQYQARRQKLEEEIEAKVVALKSEEQALEARKKVLDDRTNTHARRAIREDLILTLKERQAEFSVSPKTRSLRSPVHVVFIALLAATFGGALWSLYVWGVGANDAWGTITVTSAIKTAIFSFGFLTSAGLYISWMTRWSDKHAEAQFQLKQFEIDINRASWAVEAALEWKGAQGEQMPDVLLAGITKHLFDINAAESAEYSPLEALATSILGSASNLNLDMNGNKVAFDRKSIREIRKSGSQS